MAGPETEICCPWPTLCTCAAKRALAFDLDCSGDDWEVVLRRLQAGVEA